MKYTIELTTAERDVICDIINTIRCNSLGEYKLFENTTLFKFNEESTDYDAVYRKGVEDGNKMADKDLKEIQDITYDAAYNKALQDLTHAMKVYFPLNSEERLEHFGINIATENFAVNNPRRLIDSAKAYEEKKKAEEEIKVGDEVTVTDSDTLVGYTFIVMQIIGKRVVGIREDWRLYENLNLEYLEKTGRHFDEVEQLLDKLRGEE